jgi:CxxC-x17-CxxC domain-containing protein
MENNNNNNDRIYFAQTNFRNERRSFGIKREDRRKHAYIIGKTGMGKTTVLENMAIQDIQKGEGLGIVDPHGSFAEKMLFFVPENRIKDVIYFCPYDTDWPIAFNVMEDVGIEQRHLVAAELMGVFKKIWPDVWSPRMEYILNNAILALLEYPNSTILGINRMLSDKDYRKEVVSKITDPVVKAFWEQEFARYTDRFMTEAGAAIQNKVGQFVSNPLIRNLIGQSKSSFDMRKAMDEKKIIIMNLAKGRIGEDNSRLIGAMLITKLYLGAMARVDVSEEQRPDFYLYVDEFQNFATESFKDILSEARKYRLNLILAHQYIAQMDETVRDAVFGNVGTMIIFRVGAYDAEILEKEFAPEFTVQDIVNLGFANIYLKLMIDGVASRPFSAITLPPIPPPEKSYIEGITKYSREQYACSKEEVEKRISEWHAPIMKSVATPPPSGGASTFKPEVGEKLALPKLFDAVCSNCGVATKVPFQPDGRRPVYCKDCRASGVKPVRPPIRPIRRVLPSLQEGEFVERQSAPERITLQELKKRAEKEKPQRQKAGPDLEELRKTLEETLTKGMKEETSKEEKSEKIEPVKTENNSKKILRPGDTIKF